jgi:hypothetical protein
VGVVVLIIVKKRDLVLNVLKLRLSRRDGGGVRRLSSGCGNMGSRHGAVLRCGARCLYAGARGCIRLAILASAVSVGVVSGHRHKNVSRGQEDKSK